MNFHSRCYVTSGLLAWVMAGTTAMGQGAPPQGSVKASDAATVLHVSAAGNDAWSGRLAAPNPERTDGPLATVGAARDRIRALTAQAGGLKAPVTVLLRGGMYRQTEALTFTPADSGTAACPITFAAYPGERPVLSGGAVLRGWQRDDGARKAAVGPGKLWWASVPKLVEPSAWRFNQLFVDGQRRTRARIPAQGQFLRTDGPISKGHRNGFFFHPGDLQRWIALEEALVVVYHSWETSIHHIRSLDADNNTVTLREPAPWALGRWERQQRYYVENVFEGLDEPGEWYLDLAAARLYYYPLPGEDMSRAEVVAPVVTSTLVAIQGEPAQGAYVEHLHFKGISFQHSNAHLRRLRNPGQGEVYQPGLIHAAGLRHASFEDCEIAHSGAHAVWLAEGCSDTRLERCHLHSLGGGGVYIGGGWGVHEAARAARITVHNCFIHDGSHLFHGAHGVWIGKSSHNTISHNEISNLDYSGISCGWSWGFQASTANHNTLDNNYIHHLGNGDGLGDMGAIYTLGVSPGTTVRHNHIHDVYNYAHVSHGSGIYPDEGSSEILIENNVVYRVRNSPLFMHYGKDCLVRNNILAFGGKGQLRRSREDKPCHYVAEGNIIFADIPQMLDGPWKNGDWRLARNVYWSTAGTPDFAGMDFAAWQAKGNDAGSIVADPLLVDPAVGDFRLRPGSPALALGFRPIDVSQSGLCGDPAWVQLPRHYPNRARNEIPPPVEPPLIINFDFEADQPEEEPLEGSAAPGTSGASLKVSAGTAAGGRHSLKFTDAPGQQHTFTPHLYYRKTYETGTVRLSWDMLNSKSAPARFSVELRQYDGGAYLTGPAVAVGADGTVTAGGRRVGTVPLGVWAGAEIEITLGRDAPPVYRLALQVPGQKPQVCELPVANEAFRRITWLGISSNSQDAAEFYIDNLRMGTAEDLAQPPRRRAFRRAARPAPPANPQQLVGHWTFDDDDEYLFRDVSGHGNHADAWAEQVKGPFGKALLCEASGADVTVADDPSLHFGTGDFTIALWLCPTRLAWEGVDPRRRILGKNDHPKTWWALDVTREGKVFLEMGDANKVTCRPGSAGSIAEQAWTHFAVVVERAGRRARFYLNGALDRTVELPAAFTGPLDVAGKDLSIGSRWQPFVGLLDELRIYRRALSAAEIRTLWEEQRANRREGSGSARRDRCSLGA